MADRDPTSKRSLGGMIVTGGLGALGRAVCQAALADGAKVAILDAGRGDFDGALVLDQVDLSDAVVARRAVGQAAEALGGVRALVNLAGGFSWQRVEQAAPEEWGRLFAANVLTAANVSQAALPYLAHAGDGRIVNVGAAAAISADAGMAPYAAAKSGVHRLTEALARETRGTGTTVNAVLPSIIDTPANREAMPDEDVSTWVRPGDLAQVILFLCSPQASAVTGALIPVVGGR